MEHRPNVRRAWWRAEAQRRHEIVAFVRAQLGPDGLLQRAAEALRYRTSTLRRAPADRQRGLIERGLAAVPDLAEWVVRWRDPAADPSDLPPRDLHHAAAEALTPAPEDAAPEDDADDAPPPEERPEEETTLDRALSRWIVASFQHVEGSLTLDDLDDLVQEVVELNDARPRSWFHRGFVDALAERALAEREPGESDDGRRYYVAGFVSGTSRRARARGLEVAQSLPSADATLFDPAPTAAGSRIAEAVLLEALEQRAIPAALRWIHASRALPSSQVDAALRWARTSLSAEPADVPRVVQALQATPGWPEATRTQRRRAERWHAVAQRRLGHVAQAQRIVEGLLDDARGDERAALLQDRALLRLGVRSLEGMKVPHEGEREAYLEGLAEVSGDLADAEAAGRAPVAVWLLALPVVAQRDPDPEGPALHDALARLRRVVADMEEDDLSFWRGTGLWVQARACWSLLELRSMDPAVAQRATTRLEAVLEEAPDALPTDLLGEALELALLHGVERAAEEAVRRVDVHGWGLLERVWEEALKLPKARRTLWRWLREPSRGRTPRERFDDAARVFEASAQADPRDLEVALEAMDTLERLASEEGCAEAFVARFGAYETVESVWERALFLEVSVGLWERLGRLEEARAALSELAHEAISDGSEEAWDWIERLEALGGDATSQRVRLRADHQDASPPPAQVFFARPVSVVFVGGNETQRRYHEELRGWVEETWGADKVRLQLESPAWSSNWGRQVERLSASIDQADALVLMRFVRTQLGRALRKKASDQEIPWVACTGHGKEWLKRAIHKAVEVAAERARS